MPRRKTTRRHSIWSRGRDAQRSRRGRTRRLSFAEPLEVRRLLSGTPTPSTADFHVGTLAVPNLTTPIDLADNSSAQDVVIDFAIQPPGGAAFIAVSTALPPITRSMTIDGTTEDAMTGFPLVQLFAATGTSITDGLDVKASGVVIEGLSIGGFGSAINLDGSSATGDVIRGDYLGVAANGKTAAPNSLGVYISDGASGNVVGGGGTFTNTLGIVYPDQNLISGNNGEGVVVAGGSGNTIQGNRIGTDAGGTTALGNGFDGVSLGDGATKNLVGGTAPGDGNLISGNRLNGVYITDAGTMGNRVQGNFIGTNAAGTAALANGGAGVQVQSGASDNVVGGDQKPGNVISGNAASGVEISGSGTSGNQIQGNFIGTDVSGTNMLGNRSGGVDIAGGATNNLVGGTADGALNVISGNSVNGVEISGSGTSGNDVQGNFIGTDVSGTNMLGNLSDGVDIAGGATNNLVGGTADGALNVISGNSVNGVEISGSGTLGNDVQRNFIGTDVSGKVAVPNFDDGIHLDGGATKNIVGGTTAGEGNLLSGNFQNGIEINGSGTSNNDVQGNLIGTDASGTVAVPNVNDGVALDSGAVSNLIGGARSGTALAPGNLISGNGDDGVLLDDSSHNVLQGNSIGTEVNGQAPLGNGHTGVDIEDGSSSNVLGGPTAGEGNVISANTQSGVVLRNVSRNTIQGNTIGADSKGQKPLPNADGILIEGGAANNLVGGATTGDGNAIAFNAGPGVGVGRNTGENTIGTAIRGNSIFGNSGLGIDLSSDGVTQNTPGGPHSGPNDLQNYPVLEPSTSLGSVSGTLNSAADTTFVLDFYANPAADPSGHGQGKVYLGNTSVTTDSKGNASFTFSFTPVPGDPILSATATDPNGNTSEFSQDVGFGLQAIASSVGATESLTFNGPVATFTSGQLGATESDFTATIFWGDGSSSAGTVTGMGGTFQVAGGHAYSDAGHELLAVVVSDKASNTVTATETVAVSDASLSPTFAPFSHTEGSDFSGAVATFIDVNSKATTADFSATINWGDGNYSYGSVTGADGTFTVFGRHLYEMAAQNLGVSVAIDDVDGATATATGKVQVADATLSARGTTLGVIPGTPLSNVAVATFTDANLLATSDEFSAVIDWGDGRSSAGTVSGAGGTFTVTGSHTYGDSTNDSIVVTIADEGGATARATSTGEVGLQGTAGTNVPVVPGAALSNATVATFRDANPLATPADFTATINWGDGSSSAGTVTETAGTFRVTGSHLYHDTTNDTITVAIIDQGGATVKVTSTGNVGDANARFVAAAYLDVLGRPVDAAGLAYWDQQLDAGRSRTLVSNLIDHSAEYFGKIIIGPAYEKYLGRTPDAAGLAYWVDQMQSHGLTDEELEAGFISSPEFFHDAGQRYPALTPDQAWVTALYQAFLGRAPDSAGLSYWTGRLSGGTETEDQVALSFADSTERQQQRTNNDYFHYLGRLPDTGGLDYWVGQLGDGVTNENVITGFVASDEYFAKHTT